MARMFITLVLVGVLLVTSEFISVVTGNADQNIAHAQTIPSDSTLSPQVPTVAGMPGEKAKAIFDRHRENLLSITADST